MINSANVHELKKCIDQLYIAEGYKNMHAKFYFPLFGDLPLVGLGLLFPARVVLST